MLVTSLGEKKIYSVPIFQEAVAFLSQDVPEASYQSCADASEKIRLFWFGRERDLTLKREIHS
jgi:hypothetical protein